MTDVTCYTPKEVAKLLHTTPNIIRAQCRLGELTPKGLQSIKQGRKRFIFKVELEAWMERMELQYPNEESEWR